MNFEEKIDCHIHETAEKIRNYVKGQLKLWNAIPYFCLLSNRQSYIDRYIEELFKHHLFSVGGYRQLSVDVLSGELYADINMSASDTLIVGNYALDSIGFDAKKRIAELHQQAKDNEYSLNRWRKQYIKKYNIEIPHTILLLL